VPVINLTVKQEKFCQEYIKCGDASKAYRAAYNTKNMKIETIHRAAKQLMDNSKVAARIKKLQESIAKRNEITVDDLIKELEEARTVAATCDIPQSSTMVSATMGKAKILGLEKPIKLALTDKEGDDLFSPEDIRARVADLIDRNRG